MNDPTTPGTGDFEAIALHAQAELASRELSKRRLLQFIQRLNPRYKPGWVHEDICRRLEKFSDDVAAEKSPRLMILMPPRHGKSEIASRMYPAWHMGRNPDHEFIACSYNIGLTMSFSRKVKEAIQDPGYESVFDTRLKRDQQAVEEWGVADARGGYVAAGVGGGITGKGAHILLIDDPLKNAEEADSADIREKLWDWYGSTAYTRLAPGGGVLIIQCMTGETPVLMADGTERRLDAVRAGDMVASYEHGRLVRARVAAQRSSGHDYVLKITTTSGKIVRANGRHPFLVETGEWVRARNLTTAHKIVVLRGNGESGGVSSAQLLVASCLPSAGDCAPATTTNRSGPMALARRLSTRVLAATRTLSTATASLLMSMSACTSSRKASAPSAGWMTLAGHPVIGPVAYALTTATPRVAYGHSYATTATRPLVMRVPSALPSPWRPTCDFTTHCIASVEPDGHEEVFDIQVDRTENFIANGVVASNTWWHDDDLAGRIQLAMAEALKSGDTDVDQFVIVKYPAVAEGDEYLDRDTDLIVLDEPPENGVLLRRKGEALHPARYDLPKLNKIKATLPNRWWSALYQQDPVPADGEYFMKEQFRRRSLPQLRRSHVFVTVDFAISEKTQNDYTVITPVLQDEDDCLHVADVVRFKSKDAFFIVDSILITCARWHNTSLVLGVEDGQIWRAIEMVLKREMKKRRFYVPIQVLKPLTDKMARARALQARMQQAQMSFNSEGDWYDNARLEMLRFPSGVHDDVVDALAWGAQLAHGRPPPAPAQGKQLTSWKDKLGRFTAEGGGQGFLNA